MSGHARESAGNYRRPAAEHRTERYKEADTTDPLVALATRRRAIGAAHDMMIDPLRHQTPRFTERSLRMMNAIKRCAGLKCHHVSTAACTQFTIGGNDRAFTPACNVADVVVQGHISRSRCESFAMTFILSCYPPRRKQTARVFPMIPSIRQAVTTRHGGMSMDGAIIRR